MPILSSIGAMTFDRGFKVTPIPAIGQFTFCGFFAGVTATSSTNYTYLIVSDITIPNATGFSNYATANTNCNNLVAYSCSDWRLPTRNELGVMCGTKNQFAAIGQGYNTTPNTSGAVYRSGTSVSGLSLRYTRTFWNCFENDAADHSFVSYRAVRSQTVPIFA